MEFDHLQDHRVGKVSLDEEYWIVDEDDLLLESARDNSGGLGEDVIDAMVNE